MPVLELRTGAAATGRAAAARLPSGKVVFVEDAAPEEVVEVELVEERASFAKARLLRVLQASPHRRRPFCPLFGVCGGCVWQHFDYARQLEEKRNLLARAMQRSGFALEVPRLRPSPSEVGCRSRARLHSDPDQGTLGFFEEGSHRIQPVTSCPMLEPSLSALLEPLRKHLGGLRSLEELELNLALEGALVLAETEDDEPLDALAKGLAGEAGVAGVLLRGGQTEATCGRREGTLRVPTELGEYLVPVALGGFMQTNPGTNAALVGEILALAREFGGAAGAVTELFCGSGNFTVPLAQRGHTVDAVEMAGPSVEALERAVSAQGLSVTVHRGDARRFKLPKAKVLVLDPPRTGALEICSVLTQETAPTVIYVSCDPWTLGRDSAVLATRGYKLEKLQAFDMFPQTAHVESVAVFVR
jgi:23S rRNA (uracil1939-C5)-methyltransferase